MTQVTSEVQISAPADAVWEVLSDFGNIAIFNPAVRTSFLLNEHPPGPDATRRCELTMMGASMDERVVAWDPGRGYEIEITGGRRMPMKGARARLEVLPVDATTSRARMSITYSLRGGWFGRLFDRGAMRRQNQRTALRVLDGLKQHMETGDQINGREGLPRSAVPGGR